MTDSALIFDAEVRAFERAWRCGNAPDPRVFLPPDQPDEVRVQLIIELLCVDIEMRSTQGGGELLSFEGYFAHFPELGAVEDAPLDLIAEQYRALRRQGKRPVHANFAAQFGERRAEVADMLKLIDEELRVESDSPLLEQQVRRAIPPPALLAIDPAFLVSHRDFTLERLIGAGGEGKVYRASRRGFDAPVAIKHLRKGFLEAAGSGRAVPV